MQQTSRMTSVLSLAVIFFFFSLSVAFYTSDQMSCCDMHRTTWRRGRKFKWMLLRNKLPYENCALLGYYVVSVVNCYQCFGTTHWSHLQGSRIQKKACCPNVEFIQGRVWVVKRLSSVVSANWVYASGREGRKCGGQRSFGDKLFA